MSACSLWAAFALQVHAHQMKAEATAGTAGGHIGIVFIESIVTDPVVIQQGMEWKATHSPDFKGLEASVALKDLQDRIDHYEKV